MNIMKKFIIYFIVFFVLGFVASSCKSKYSKEIEKSCADCIETEIRESDFILVTNKNGESNVFSKNKMTFVLSKWYPAKYDEGVFFDDITFNIADKKVMCSESDYNSLSDDFINGKLESMSSSVSSSSSGSYSSSSSSSNKSSSSEITCVHGKRWVDCCRYRFTRP